MGFKSMKEKFILRQSLATNIGRSLRRKICRSKIRNKTKGVLFRNLDNFIKIRLDEFIKEAKLCEEVTCKMQETFEKLF